MKRLLLILPLSMIASLSSLAQEVTREEFNTLLQRIDALERGLSSARNLQMESLATEAISQMPESQVAGESRESLIEEVVTRIQKREESVNYPWMELTQWDGVRKRMSSEQVIEILGPPTLDEPSLHKRKDRVFTWQGRRVATGERVEAIIRFYKNKVIEIEPPGDKKPFVF